MGDIFQEKNKNKNASVFKTENSNQTMVNV